MKIKELNLLRARIESLAPREQYFKAVRLYALELIDNTLEAYSENGDELLTLAILLNGAHNWMEYSFGGCALSYTDDIIDRIVPISMRAAARAENKASIKALTAQALALEDAARLIFLTANYI